MNNQYKYRRNRIVHAIVIILVFMFFSLISGCKPNDSTTKIRIGWQVSWATQAQIALTLKHTDILKQHGLKGDFFGFTYGAPLSEAALSGRIDVGFAADQPVASLIAAGGKFKIVARLMYFRGGIIVPTTSEIKNLYDLKGKTLAVPFGSTTHRIVLGMLEDAGLSPQRDLNIINIDIAEQAGIVMSGTDDKWKGDIDALGSWDPNIAVFLNRNLARVLNEEFGLAVMYMSEDFINKNQDASVRFIMAYIESYYFYVSNTEQTNQWFVDEARIEFEPSILDMVASFEPNFYAESINDINVIFNENDFAMMEAGIEFGLNQGIIKIKPDIKASVDTSLLIEAMDKFKKNENYQK